ncbi:MAG: cytochrome c oxidase subunit II [bacterium]
MFRKAEWLSALVAVATIFPSLAQASETEKPEGWLLNMPKGVTSVSQQVYDVHMLIFWICVVIGVGVFGVMFYSMFKYRKSKGAVAANFHENTVAEIVWTVIPALILLGMAWPATTTLVHLYDASDAELDIKVTGYQWKWQYEYLGEGVSFMSELSTPQSEIYGQEKKANTYLQQVNNPLVIPVDTKVRFLTTAKDVIHSWWIPDFAVKKDAIPGFINETWAYVEETGTYRGECAELCGKDHAFMPVVVEVVKKEAFNTWIADKKAEAAAIAELTGKTFTLEELMEKGETAYNQSCAACHQANGQGIPGVFPPMVGSPYITGAVADHIDIVVNGKAGTAMQAFGQQLSEVDLAAIITYERNAWGINSGDVVQPIDVLNFKQGQ